MSFRRNVLGIVSSTLRGMAARIFRAALGHLEQGGLHPHEDEGSKILAACAGAPDHLRAVHALRDARQGMLQER